jgi:hypothetical protein
METKERIRSFLYQYSQVAGVTRRNSGKCFSVIHLPPGFGGVNLALPRGNERGDFIPQFNFFTASLFQRGKK